MQAPKDVYLAAADDVTRQRCVRAIQAASAGGGVSSLQDIASSLALTLDLIGIQSLPAVNAVLAALGKDEAALKKAGFDLASLKGAGFDCSSLVRAGFDAAALKGAGFSIRDIAFDGNFARNSDSSERCGAFEIVRVKNRFKEESPVGGYRDVNIKVRIGFKSSSMLSSPIFVPVEHWDNVGVQTLVCEIQVD